LPGLRTILHCRTYRIQQVQPLIDSLLCIGRRRALIRSRCLTGDVSVAGVIGAKPLAAASLRVSGRSAGYTIPDIARPACGIAALTCLAVVAIHATPALTSLPLTALLTLTLALTWSLAATLLLAGLSILGLLLTLLATLASLPCLPP
jgi:hypothetical protein